MVDESSVVDKHKNFGLVIKMIIAVNDINVVFAGRQASRQTDKQAGREGDRQGRRLPIGRFQLGAAKCQWPSAEHNREQLE